MVKLGITETLTETLKSEILMFNIERQKISLYFIILNCGKTKKNMSFYHNF